MIALAVVLVVALVGRELAHRVGQPAVLGELLAGVALGGLVTWGPHGLASIASDPTVEVVAHIGVLILLFQVGLEVTVKQMMQVGTASFAVAVLGVAAPFALGWLAGAWLLPGESRYVHAFLGATLCATSVGITARVLKDLGAARSATARIILGAAVIDDVLGLVILSVLTGVIVAANGGSRAGMGPAALIVVKAVVFLAAVLAAGRWLAPALFRAAARRTGHGGLLPLSLALCFALSWAAEAIGLAAIVGAFGAGLILEEAHLEPFHAPDQRALADMVAPVGGFLVPVFFVLMGMRTDLRALVRPGVPALAAALIVAAVLGKQLCALGATGRGVNRLAVGVGMIPRGEVGLIFASVGVGLTVAGERIVNAATYSAVVVMVIATTLMTPPLLKWALKKGAR